MANIKHVNSVVDRDFRNRINQLIDIVNDIGTSLNDLVVKGVMTTEQYSQLLASINGLVKTGEINKDTLSVELKNEIEKINNKVDKGNVSVADINKNLGKLDQTFLSDELLQQIAGTAPINVVPADDSITGKKLVDGSITADKTDFVKTGKNLVNPNKILKNKVLGLNGIFDNELYSVYMDLPVKLNEPVTISTLRNYSFLDNNKELIIHDSLMSRNNYTFMPTQDGFLRVSVFNTDLHRFQIEKGTNATSYEPYKLELSDDIKVTSLKIPNKDLTLLVSEGKYTIKSILNGKTLNILTEKFGSSNNSFNFISTHYDEKLIHSTIDDITPVRTFNTVGGNHGYTSILKVPNTNKTTSDLGSVWTDGVIEFTLLRIVDDLLVLGLPYDDSNGYVTATSPNITADELIHVRNATNTTSIPTANRITGSQLYPSTSNIKVNYYCDGELVDSSGEYNCNKIDVVESYQILDYKSIMDFARSNVGKDYANHKDSIQGVLAMSNTFTFYGKGKCTTSHSIRALQKVLMGRTGVLQSTALIHSNFKVYRYVPNVKAKGSVDFTNPIDLSTYNTNNYIYRSDLIEESKPVDRYIDYIQNGSNVELAFTMGHIVDKTNSKYEDRLANVTSILWDFRSTKKSYPTVIENKVLEVGDYFSFQGYRNYFIPESGLVNSNLVKDNQATYIYIDKLTSTPFDSSQFKELLSKKITVVASDGFTLKSDVIDSNGLNYAITKANGYAILKVE